MIQKKNKKIDLSQKSLTSTLNLETLISDMVNDKLPAWFMRSTQAAEVIAIMKREVERAGAKADHIPV